MSIDVTVLFGAFKLLKINRDAPEDLPLDEIYSSLHTTEFCCHRSYMVYILYIFIFNN